MMNFNSIDVETANADRASICQIGIVHVHNGEVVDQWKTLVNPKDWFDELNVSIHGIDETKVEHSPTLPEIRDELRSRLRGSILVSHTSFDRVAFKRAMSDYGLEQLQVTWLDSARIARRAWPEKFGRTDWGLKSVTSYLGISFRHHDALEDARAAAEIVLRACAETSIDVEGWLRQVKRPVFPSSAPSVKREGNIDSPLFGETAVFTGDFAATQREMADLAAHNGCDVIRNVSKKVTILVVGIQD